jgi:transcriptional regulator with XRE-family HTH domain
VAECKRELEYLRNLHRQYNHYFKKYFGFSEKDIADFMGISKARFSYILSEKVKMDYGLEQRFLEAFKHFDIEAKTKDFRESEGQRSIRTLWRKIRLDKRLILWIIIITMLNTAFFNPTYNNFPQCINFNRRLSQLSDVLFNLILAAIASMGFLFINRKATQTQVKGDLSFLF